MTAASDVLEMQELCGEIADRSAATHHLKIRVAAVVEAFRNQVTDNRAYEFLRGKALRVDSWEKDVARQVRDRLRAKSRAEKHRAHLEWLESQIGRFRASGEELHGPHIDGLVDLLRMARAEAGAVAVPTDAEDPFDFSD